MESRSAIWIRIGQLSSPMRLIARFRPSCRTAWAPISLRQVGPAIAAYPGSASSLLIAAAVPGAAAIGIMWGSRPRRAPAASRIPWAVTRASWPTPP